MCWKLQEPSEWSLEDWRILLSKYVFYSARRSKKIALLSFAFLILMRLKLFFFFLCGYSSDDLWHWTCLQCVVSWSVSMISFSFNILHNYNNSVCVATAVSNTRFLSAITNQNNTAIIRNANMTCSLLFFFFIHFPFQYTHFLCTHSFYLSLLTVISYQYFLYKCVLLCFAYKFMVM